MEKFIGKNVIVTTEAFFIAPDGQQYKAMWGKLIAIRKVDEIIGFAPNRPNVNWVYEISDMIIYGCQVKFIALCPQKPDNKPIKSWDQNATDGIKLFEVPCFIYISDYD